VAGKVEGDKRPLAGHPEVVETAGTLTSPMQEHLLRAATAPDDTAQV
jgi:hypothetical protein